MPQQITSRDNDKIKFACKMRDNLAFRREQKMFMAEGLKLCKDLAQTLKITTAFFTEKAFENYPNIENICENCYLITDNIAEKLSDTSSPQGLFCLFEMPQRSELFCGKWLALENVQDPANVGTILRSAAAFGFSGAVLSAGCADAFSPKAIRASMGAIAKLPLILDANLPSILAQMQALGITTIAAALYNSAPLASVKTPANPCIVIGSEGQGLTEQTVKACSICVRIPISKMVESLNAAAAASVLLWHFGGDLYE